MRILITGASSGIGRDMARVLAKKGNELILVARDEEKLNQIEQELEDACGSIRTIATDLSNEENCIKLHNDIKYVELLINNAGFGDCGDFDQTSLEKDLKMIQTNIIAYHILTKLYLADMKEENRGTILNVASIAGFMPGPMMATYYATKAYIVSLSEAIREELRRENSNVKISILCPGPVSTNFNKVANVEFRIKEANSRKVAEYAIKKMEEGKFYIVPGTRIKLTKIGAKLLPTSYISKKTYDIQKRKIQGKE